MAYSGLPSFIEELEEKDELSRVKVSADPVLEITEIADRISKSGGKALLFEDTGTSFPVLINAFGSDLRLSMALGRKDINGFENEIEDLLKHIPTNRSTFLEKLSALPAFFRIAGFFPAYSRKRGACQQVIHTEPDLEILPIL